MSGTNHVAGGVVFTGIWASFWNINIFSKPEFIAFCAVFAVLADIDHLKSPIGKVFYPIAKYIDRNYGHRTITHSLIFYLSFGLLVAFIEKIFSYDFTITLIFFLAYASHLIFDMMTKQGVPLMYPWRRNACVIPGNPELRFKSSDLKTESSIFVIFLILGLTCQSLFANGFWTTYNRAFGTLQHVASEFKNSDNFIKLSYDFSVRGHIYKGTGIIVSAEPSKAIIFDNGFLTIDKGCKINSLLPEKTNKKYFLEEYFFYNINQDSLFKLIKNKPLITIKIQSLSKISYLKKNKPTEGTAIDLEYVYNPKLIFIDDSLKANVRKQLELLNYELNKLKREKDTYNRNKEYMVNRINEIQRGFYQMDFYQREKATIELKELSNKKDALIEYTDDREKILLKIKHLNQELEKVKTTTCNVYISYLKL